MKLLLSIVAIFCIVLFVDVAESRPIHGGYGVGYYNNYVQNDVIIGIPIAPDYYYSVGDGLTQEEREKRIADAVVKKFAEKFQIGGDKESEQETVGRDLFRLVGGASGLDTNRRVFALLNNSCIKCHKPGSDKPGRIRLFTADRKLFVDSDSQKEYARRLRVYESVESGEMPKNGPALSAGEKQLLREWLNLSQVKK